MEPLVTPRLTLEPQTIARFEAWREMDRARPEDGQRNLTEDEAWLRLLARQGQWAGFGYGFFFIFDRAKGTMIGEVGLQRRQRELGPKFDPYPEAAWVVRADRRGEGIAQEAMGTVRTWLAATKPELDRLVALIAAGNSSSMSVASRLGFQCFAEVLFRGEPYLLYDHSVVAQRQPITSLEARVVTEL